MKLFFAITLLLIAAVLAVFTLVLLGQLALIPLVGVPSAGLWETVVALVAANLLGLIPLKLFPIFIKAKS